MEDRILLLTIYGLGTVSVLFQGISFGCPGWLLIVHSHGEINYAIWYVRQCLNGYCSSESYDDVFENSGYYGGKEFAYSQFIELMIESTVAMVSCCVGIFLAVLFTRTELSSSTATKDIVPIMLIASVLLLFLSGAVIFVPVAKFEALRSFVRIQIRRGVYGHFSDVQLGAPYGMVMAGFGGCTTIITAFMLIITFVRHKLIKHPRLVTVEEELPMEDDRERNVFTFSNRVTSPG